MPRYLNVCVPVVPENSLGSLYLKVMKSAVLPHLTFWEVSLISPPDLSKPVIYNMIHYLYMIFLLYTIFTVMSVWTLLLY